MKLLNTTSQDLLVGKARDGKSVTIKAGQTIILFDEEVEKNESLLKLINSGKLQKVSGEEPYEATYNIDSDLSAQIAALAAAVDDLLVRVSALEGAS